jgi:putative ABC transport system substrate-binding protein
MAVRRLLALVVGCLLSQAAMATSVLVVLSEAGGAYAEFAEALKAERDARGGYSIVVLQRADFSPKRSAVA